MVKNIIFDLGNVIFLLKYDEYLDRKFGNKYSKEEKEEIKKNSFLFKRMACFGCWN